MHGPTAMARARSTTDRFTITFEEVDNNALCAADGNLLVPGIKVTLQIRALMQRIAGKVPPLTRNSMVPEASRPPLQQCMADCDALANALHRDQQRSDTSKRCGSAADAVHVLTKYMPGVRVSTCVKPLPSSPASTSRRLLQQERDRKWLIADEPLFAKLEGSGALRTRTSTAFWTTHRPSTRSSMTMHSMMSSASPTTVSRKTATRCGSRKNGSLSASLQTFDMSTSRT